MRGGDEKGIEYAKKKPEIVKASMAEIQRRSKFGVDVLKMEVPVQMEFVAGTKASKGASAYTREEALGYFRSAAEARQSLSFIFRPEYRTRYSSKRWSWQVNRALNSMASSAGAPTGKMAFPSTRNRAPKHLRSG